MKGFTTVELTTESGKTLKVKAGTNQNSPYHISGSLFGTEIFNEIEDGETVSIKDYGQFQVRKQQPTFLEEGKVTVVLP